MAGVLAGLAGCAEVMLVINTAVFVNSFPSSTPHWVEVARMPLSDPPEAVYAALLAGASRDGREIVEQDAAAQTLRVSYPGTLMRWAGSLTIKVTEEERATLVTILGERKDREVRKVVNAVLDDLGATLRRQARAL